jgi:hypothetical protein
MDSNGATPTMGQSQTPKPWAWTEDLPDTEHVRFFKSTKWAETPLGPLEEWGTALKLYTHTVLTDSRPAYIAWSAATVLTS